MARPKKIRKYTPVEIEQLITYSDRALYNALIVLYDCQMEDEQLSGTSLHHNRRGFAKPDAKMLTGMAKMVLNEECIDFDKKNVLRKKLLNRYVNQITKICNETWEDLRMELI